MNNIYEYLFTIKIDINNEVDKQLLEYLLTHWQEEHEAVKLFLINNMIYKGGEGIGIIQTSKGTTR